MSLFSRFFGGRESALERDTRRVYVQMLRTIAGYPAADAEQAVSDAITLCKQEGDAQGTADWPSDFGDRLIEAARMGEPTAQRVVMKARREGATDDDITEWWNLPDLTRRMVIWSENVFRLGAYRHAKEDEGMSAENAATRVHKIFPLYGDPEDTSKLWGENRPLPHELRGRVDSFRKRHNAQDVLKHAVNYSSFNAFVRVAIRDGLL